MKIKVFSSRNKPNVDLTTEGPVLWEGPEGNQENEIEGEKNNQLYNIPVNPKAIPGEGMIWVVQSPEGGDGATTLATNLAALLAITSPENVALIDLDGIGAIRSRMGYLADSCFVNILDWQDITDFRDINRAMVQHSSGVMVVPGILHQDHLSFITPSFVFKILTILKERFNHIVLDCSPVGQENNTWAAALVADVIFTVIKPDRTSIDLVKNNLSYLARLGCDERSSVVLNQTGIPGGLRTSDMLNSKDSDIKIHYTLPYSIGVMEANNKRELVSISKPRDEFTVALRNMVKKLEGRE